MALSLVLAGGSLFSAQAEEGAPPPTVHSPTPSGCVSCQVKKDTVHPFGSRSPRPRNDWQRDEMNGPVSPY